MGVLKNIKEGWELGRDIKKEREENRKLHKIYNATVDALDDELGEDPEQDEVNKRSYRTFENIYYPAKDKSLEKYPRGFAEAGEKLGFAGTMASIAAENLPRKRKATPSPKKRKTIKKKNAKCICRKK